jgi:hypothetical protein
MTCTGGGTCVASPTDCPGSFLFCDGFESGTIDPSLWAETTPADSRQSIGVSNAYAHHGTWSLHVHVNALNDGLYLQSRVGENKTGSQNLLYIRFFYMLSGLPGPDEGMLTLPSSSNTNSASGSVGLSQSGTFTSSVSNTAGNVYDYGRKGTTLAPVGLGTWTCVELMVDATYNSPNPNGLLQVYHGSSTTPDSELTGTAELQSVVAVLFGMDFSTPSGGTPTSAVDLYFDDIAIGTQYIGCDQ